MNYHFLYLGGWDWDKGKQLLKHSQNVNVARHILCTHAYIVRDKFIPTLLNQINTRVWKVDVLFSEALEKGKCYIASPTLAWQSEGYSDIRQQHSKNKHLK